MFDEIFIENNKLFYKHNKKKLLLTEKNLANFFKTNFYFKDLTLEKSFVLFEPYKNIINEINNIDYDSYHEELKKDNNEIINCDICISDVCSSRKKEYYSGELNENRVYIANEECVIPDFYSKNEISLFNGKDVGNRISYDTDLSKIKNSKIVMKDIFFTEKGNFIQKKDDNITLYDFIKLIFGFENYSPAERVENNEKLKKMIEEAFVEIEEGKVTEMKFPNDEDLQKKADECVKKYKCPVIIENNEIIVITENKPKKFLEFSFNDLFLVVKFKTKEEYKESIPV